MKNNISTKPYFIFLLPLFFVLHGYMEFIGFASFLTLIPLLITYLISITCLWLILILVFRNKTKAALMSIALAGFYLFFGALFDFLKAHSPWRFLYKYSVLLIMGAAMLIWVFVYLRKTTSTLKTPVFFINLLLLIYILFDLSQAVFSNRNELQLWKGPSNQANGVIPDAVAKPDIYLLVFDTYSSTYGLKQLFNFNNNSFDSALAERDFRLAPKSRSNYSTTSFSMASTFNMDYLNWLDATQLVTRKDYAMSTTQIYDNKAMDFLARNEYEIVNYSIFDLKGHPSLLDNPWRTVYANIISEGTLGTRLVIQFRWWLNGTPVINKLLPFFAWENDDVNNRKTLNNVREESSKERKAPRFVYGHFLMPHAPYFRNKLGMLRPRQEYDDVSWHEGPDNYYTEYLQYTNKEILNLIDTIKTNTKGKAIIILMSDHGYHSIAPDDKKQYIWNNLNAWYMPGELPKQFHDSITNVNQFRILFNSLFHQQYPIMKDSFMRISD